jgi:hypothetical protein
MDPGFHGVRSAAGRNETGHSRRSVGCRTLWIRASTAFGRLPDAVKPGIHSARTHWIRGFMAFRLARRTRTAMLMVPT